LLDKFQTDHGRELRIKVACIDSGGHATAQVMRFAFARFGRRVYAVKGAPGPKPIWPRKESRSKKNAGSLFIVGVDTAKDAIYGRLTITRPGPGRIHFPVGAPFDQAYFDQLTSEQVQTKKSKDGRPLRAWVLPNGRTNEALDTFVYCLAARHSLRVRLDKPLAQAPAAAVPSPPPPPAEAEPEPTPVPAPREETPQPFRPVIRHSHFEQRQQGGGWMGGRRGSWWDRR
jgi:phage terminase large subunit GpA-like protein